MWMVGGTIIGMAQPPTKILRATYVHRGQREQVEVEVPDAGDSEDELLQEASHFLQSLEDNHQLEHDGEPAVPGTTHRIESRPDGTRRLIRKRFSAI